MNRTATLLVLAAVLAGAGLGCKKPNMDKGYTAPQLLSMSQRLMDQGKYDEARRHLRSLEENLPGSPEFPRAKLLLADSFFFQNTPSYPEAEVEYQSFLNYFPRHELRDYALYHKALCHFSSIESAERDQAETRKALTDFQNLLAQSPGSPYAAEAKAKVVQCWRRIADHELEVGIFYVNALWFAGAESRLKQVLVDYPDYVDRERAYFYLGEAMRQRALTGEEINQFSKDYLNRLKKEHPTDLTPEESQAYTKELKAFVKEKMEGFRAESKDYYQKLVESYPNSEWARRAADRLADMGTTTVKESLDS